MIHISGRALESTTWVNGMGGACLLDVHTKDRECETFAHVRNI